MRPIDDRNPDGGMSDGSEKEQDNRGDHVCGTGRGS